MTFLLLLHCSLLSAESIDLPKTASLANMLVCSDGRIRPFEASAKRWWEQLNGSVASIEEKDPILSQAQPWQIQLSLNFLPSSARQSLAWIPLHPTIAKALNANPRQRYSAHEIYQMASSSPHWPSFVYRLTWQALASHKKQTPNQTYANSIALSSIDPTLHLIQKGQSLWVDTPASNPLLRCLNSNSHIDSSFDVAGDEEKAWFQLESSLSALGLPQLETSSLVIRSLATKTKPIKWLILRPASLGPSSAVYGPRSSLNQLSLTLQELSSGPEQRAKQSWQKLAELMETIQGSYRQDLKLREAIPSIWQVESEKIYMRYSWLSLISAIYFLACIGQWLSKRFRSLSKISCATFLTAFALHTLLLALRVYILERPPVANMEETALYVPWIACLIGSWMLYSRYHLGWVVTSLASACLLSLMHLMKLEPGLDIVPAVLNSQLWLSIHVLMVVGSYGLFMVSSALSHVELWRYTRTKAQINSNLILATLTLGTLMLIIGTLLGGVWAAQSWGRFWDWDPKESWAFISCASYLLILHSWAFRKLTSYGLILSAIAAFWVISFTWYGVNLILATGLHTYGFAQSSGTYYLAALGLDALGVCGLYAYQRLQQSRCTTKIRS